ncbi:MAG: hypothetical protein LQ342_002444 [Letrouitia transgressa]|nr:MAG: hypothetical protein LQ342_002444 [Letrouitia transgressa]
MDDAKLGIRQFPDPLRVLLTILACETGVDGVDVVIGTSSYLREHSHGKDMTSIRTTAIEVINYVKSQGKQIRFSSEDSFRSDLVDLLTIYSAVDQVGVDRVGIADTVHRDAFVSFFLAIKVPRLQLHSHNDTGCAIAREYVKSKYNLHKLKVRLSLLTGIIKYLSKKLTRRSKISSRMQQPSPTEEIDLSTNSPATSLGCRDVGYYHTNHRLTVTEKPRRRSFRVEIDWASLALRNQDILADSKRWNAIKSRADQLGFQMTDDQIKLCTAQLKALADVRRTSIDDADSVIRRFHFNLHNEHEEPLMPGMTTTEQEAFLEAQKSLSNEAEGKRLIDQVDQQAGIPVSKKVRTEVSS